jgi:hypothetical protein
MEFPFHPAHNLTAFGIGGRIVEIIKRREMRCKGLASDALDRPFLLSFQLDPPGYIEIE